MRKSDKIAMAIGAILAVLFIGTVFFYIPMSMNYAECGSILLCK